MFNHLCLTFCLTLFSVNGNYWMYFNLFHTDLCSIYKVLTSIKPV